MKHNSFHQSMSLPPFLSPFPCNDPLLKSNPARDEWRIIFFKKRQKKEKGNGSGMAPRLLACLLAGNTHNVVQVVSNPARDFPWSNFFFFGANQQKKIGHGGSFALLVPAFAWVIITDDFFWWLQDGIGGSCYRFGISLSSLLLSLSRIRWGIGGLVGVCGVEWNGMEQSGV